MVLKMFVSVLAAFAVGAFRVLPCLGRISIALNQVTNALLSINSVYQNLQEAEAYAIEHQVPENRHWQICCWDC